MPKTKTEEKVWISRKNMFWIAIGFILGSIALGILLGLALRLLGAFPGLTVVSFVLSCMGIAAGILLLIVLGYLLYQHQKVLAWLGKLKRPWSRRK